jgi:hypothetical protein
LGGQQRLPGNLIWYGSFYAVNASSSSGGKGLFSGGSAGNGYQYYASFMLAACEGPDLSELVATWVNGTQYLQSEQPIPQDVFLGTYAQDVWPDGSAIGVVNYYRGLAHADFFNYPLGSSAGLPQINLEFLSTNSGVLAGQPDGDPSVCWTKFFTDPLRGLGFPSYRMGSLTAYQQYCLATGMVVSPVLASAVTASSFAKDLIEATNSNARWSAGLLSVIPYGDQQITAGTITPSTEEYLVGVGSGSYDQIEVEFAAQFVANTQVVYTTSGNPLTQVYGSALPGPGQYNIGGGPGISPAPGYYLFNSADAGNQVSITYTYAEVASYTPNVTPVYALTLDNFLPNQGTIGQGVAINNSPLIVVRKPRDQMLNVVKLTYLDRNNSYNPVTIEAKNEAALQAFGRWRADTAKQYDFFCLAAAAQQSATLRLAREQIARTFQWTSGKQFILLDVMDIVEVSDPGQGIVNQAVRITEIQENEDFSLMFTAEEFLGTATAPLYNIQANSGFVPNFNGSPGNANPPIIFEPTDELGGGLEVWAAVSGADTATWGGCNVWISTDGENYTKAGQILGAATMGVTTADFPAVSVNPTGQTIDQTNTLAVNLSESEGTLISGTLNDALSLAMACYVGGEIASYEDATLTSPYNYDLTYLVRGAFGTESEIVDHPVGTPFAWLASNIFKYAYNQNQIGSTIYIKFQGFNQYQGGVQELSECAAYPYTITGAALASPLPNVTNLRTVFNVNTGFEQLIWDDVSDFRSPSYEVRVGASWAAGATLSSDAVSPFTVPGNGTYWVSAFAQPTSGLSVYSEEPQSVTIAGAVITQNVIFTIDLAAEKWPGTFAGSIGVDTTLNALRTGGAGDILAASPFLEELATNAGTSAGGNVLSFASFPVPAFTSLGSAAAPNAGGTTTSVSLTTTATVPKGATICVGTIDANTNGQFWTTYGTVSDGTNGYTGIAHAQIGGSSNPLCTVWTATASEDLPAGSTITYESALPPQVNGDMTLVAFYVTGVSSGTVIDAAVTAINSANGASPTVTGGSPAATNELTVGLLMANMSVLTSGADNLVEPAGWSTGPVNYGTARGIFTGYKAASTAQTFAPTGGSGSANYSNFIISFLPGVAAGLAVNDTTNPSAIPSGTLVESSTATLTGATVTLSGNVASPGVSSGDEIVFSVADVLNYGGESTTGGTYFPSGATIDVGYVANVSISIKYQPTGVPVGQDILTIANILETPDILGSASAAFVTGYPLIETATGEGDLYTLGDLYQYTDLYDVTAANWGAYQKFAPGTYQAQFLNFAFFLETMDPNTEGYNLEFAITATIPPRIDQYPLTTSASAATTVTFGQAGVTSTAPLTGTSSPFNGGSAPGGFPAMSWGITNAQAGDDLIISALSNSAVTFAVWNSGAMVSRQLTLFAEGF